MQRNNYSEATKKNFLQEFFFSRRIFWVRLVAVAESRRPPAGFFLFKLCGRRSSRPLFDLLPDKSRNRKRRPDSHPEEASASPPRSGESRARRPRSISAPASYARRGRWP